MFSGLHFFTNIWNKVSHTGTEFLVNERLKRKVIICNRLAFTVGLLPVLTSIILFLNLETRHFFFSPLIVGLLYLLTLVFNKYRLYKASRIYLSIFPTINLMFISGILGDEISLGMKFSYFSIIVAPMVLFDLNEKKNTHLLSFMGCRDVLFDRFG